MGIDLATKIRERTRAQLEKTGLFPRSARKSGLAPGTLVHIGEKPSEPPRITLIDYNLDHIEEREVPSIEECFPYRDSESVTWINVDGVHDVDLIEKLGEHFGLHALLLEDIVNTQQRPKLEDFGDFVFLVLRMLSLRESDSGLLELEHEQLSMVLGSKVLITFQERAGDVFDPIRTRLRLNRGRVRAFGADHLAYSLLDVVVDNYFTVLERLGDEVEALEAELLERAQVETLQHIHHQRRMMIAIRRAVWPLRDVINGILRGDVQSFRKPTLVFMRDVYDHTIRAVELTETFREMLAGMHELYLSQISYRMNEVMKILTIIATIFIPLTFIAGVYGMNFDNMPELHWRFGYWFVWAVMLGTGVVFFFFFKRKHWL